MMHWQVTSRTYGGTRYTAAQAEEYRALTDVLVETAARWRAAANSWSTALMELTERRATVMRCPALGGGAVDGHVTLPYERLCEQCGDNARSCDAIADTLNDMVSLVSRAHQVYSDGELLVRQIFNKCIQGFSSFMPPGATAGFTALLYGGGVLAGSIREGRLSLLSGLETTSFAHEGLFTSLASWLTGGNPILAMLRPDELNHAAGRFSLLSGPADGLRQGPMHITEVHTDVDVVRSSHSVSASLENLRRLAEERLGKIDLDSGLSHATIAIQRYRHEDGTSSWLVTIPGTDGKLNSPFGWPQNAELMSNNRTQRMQADSARMVAAAMERAGIGPDEPVALIGHSQGGIVAATLAADEGMQERYDIAHVVTAGSPVANHPIPDKTWVTSIEIDDEVVAALDGAPNPATEHWLTIRGHVTASDADPGTINPDGSCTPGDGLTDRDRNYTSAQVPGSTEGKELTHWLKYHQAAYRNASDLGSLAVDTHERHFQQILDGELEETRYFQGRMGYGAPQ